MMDSPVAMIEQNVSVNWFMPFVFHCVRSVWCGSWVNEWVDKVVEVALSIDAAAVGMRDALGWAGCPELCWQAMSGIVLVTGAHGCCTLLACFWIVGVCFEVELSVC